MISDPIEAAQRKGGPQLGHWNPLQAVTPPAIVLAAVTALVSHLIEYKTGWFANSIGSVQPTRTPDGTNETVTKTLIVTNTIWLTNYIFQTNVSWVTNFIIKTNVVVVPIQLPQDDLRQRAEIIQQPLRLASQMVVRATGRVELEAKGNGRTTGIGRATIKVYRQFKDGPLTFVNEIVTDDNGIGWVQIPNTRGEAGPQYYVLQFPGNTEYQECEFRRKIK